MNSTRMFRALALGFGGPLALMACTNASDVTQSLCCTDPTDVALRLDPAVRGEFNVFVKTAANLNGAAKASLTDVTQACRSIALDLGATATDQSGIETSSKTEEGVADGWCTLAASKIQAALASSTTTIKYDPPRCEASVNAKASCNAECTGSASCDVKAKPPVCTGGEMVVECKGQCKVKPAQVSIKCTGKCTGKCSGRCSASVTAPSVTCDGTCQGNCSAGGTAGGTGIQADGSCRGLCEGTCTARPGSAALACEGECSGTCDAACDVNATGGSVRCTGECTAESTPISCEGGTLTGGCDVEAKCDASCKASVDATAKCEPPSLDIKTDTSKLASLIGTLNTNLPTLLTVIDARGKSFADGVSAVADLAAKGQLLDGDKLGVAGSACVVVLGSQIADSAAQASAALSSALKVQAAFGAKLQKTSSTN